MKNINFNNKVKSLLNKHAVPSDHDAIWKNVNSELIKRKRRKGFLLFFIIPFAFISLLTVLFLLKKENTLQNLTIPTKLDLIDNSQRAIASSTSNSEKYVIAVDNINSSSTTKNNTNKFNTSTSNINTKNDKVPLSKAINDELIIKRNKKFTTNSVTVKSELPRIKNIDSKSSLNSTISSAIPPQNLNSSEDLINPFSGLMASIDYTVNYKLSLPTIRPKEDFIQDKINPWQIGFYFAPGLFTSNIVAINDDFKTNSIALKRSIYEDPVEEISVGTEMVLNVNKNWSFSTGIEYTKLIEKFEASYSDTIVEHQDNVLIGIILRSTNQQHIDEIYGSAPVTKIMSVYQKTYNRYHFLSIPFLINYNINYNKIKLGIHAGMNFQSLFSISGQAFDQDGLTSLSNNKTNGQKVYSSSFNINPIVGLDLVYRANSNMSYYFSPEVIPSINGLANLTSGLKHQVNRYRLRFGARFHM